MIENPILPGFNPDPSILRVGFDYYIATSTFEWLPGIQIHHSRDLQHWQLIGHALNRASQIDLRGVAPSKGVWAPDLSHDGNQFWLCYSVVRQIADNFFDVDNFMVTAPTISGPWSNPVYLNSSGFDPSLFHDSDGRKWLINLEWDFREGYEHPGAIVLQEFDADTQKLIGQASQIYRGGSDLGCVEGAHFYRHGEWYYLMAAEGGTGYGHGVTVARSKSLSGPWEPDSKNPILTSTAHRFKERGKPDYLKPEKFNPDSYLQKSGHGSLVATPDGEYYIAHLCARPYLPELRCMLGRETAIQKAFWSDDGWLRIEGDGPSGNIARRKVTPPACRDHLLALEPERDDFTNPNLSPHFATPRVHASEDWLSLSARPGYLRLRGQESLFSTFNQSLVARRVQHFDFRVETCLEFSPRCFQEMAGLVCLYDTANFMYLRLYWSQTLHGPALGIMHADNGHRKELLAVRTGIGANNRVELAVQVRNRGMQFSFAVVPGDWQNIGPVFDASSLSDEYCRTGEFTGAFVGICVQDLARRQAIADFDWFSYQPIRGTPEYF